MSKKKKKTNKDKNINPLLLKTKHEVPRSQKCASGAGSCTKHSKIFKGVRVGGILDDKASKAGQRNYVSHACWHAKIIIRNDYH